MTLVSQSDAVPLIRSRVCPACAQQMRLESSRPSETYANVRHFIFVCDCGVTTDRSLLFLSMTVKIDANDGQALEREGRERPHGVPPGVAIRSRKPPSICAARGRWMKSGRKAEELGLKYKSRRR